MERKVHLTVALATFLVISTVPTHSKVLPQHGMDVANTRIVNIPGISDQRFPQGELVPRPVAVSHPNFQRPDQSTATSRPTAQRQPVSATFPKPTTTTRRTPLPTTTTTTPRRTNDPPQSVTQRPGEMRPPAGAGVIPQSPPANRDRHCGIFPSPGECQAAFPRYYYNNETSQCDCYLYGGCDEDVGSYKTLDECHNRCQPYVKDEGPSCEFVFIDNFSPLKPEMTTARTPSTTPSHSISTAPTSPTGNRRPPTGNSPLVPNIAKPPTAGVSSDPTRIRGSAGGNNRNPSTGSVSFPQPLDIKGVAFPNPSAPRGGPQRPFNPRTSLESPDYEKDDDYW